MEFGASVSSPDVVTGPEAILNPYQQLLHVVGTALQQQFHSLDWKRDVRIMSRLDGQNEEVFPKRQVGQISRSQMLDLEDHIRELCARIEDARVTLETCGWQASSRTMRQSHLHPHSVYAPTMNAAELKDCFPLGGGQYTCNRSGAVHHRQAASLRPLAAPSFGRTMLSEPDRTDGNVEDSDFESQPLDEDPSSGTFDDPVSNCEGSPSEHEPRLGGATAETLPPTCADAAECTAIVRGSESSDRPAASELLAVSVYSVLQQPGCCDYPLTADNRSDQSLLRDPSRVQAASPTAAGVEPMPSMASLGDRTAAAPVHENASCRNEDHTTESAPQSAQINRTGAQGQITKSYALQLQDAPATACVGSMHQAQHQDSVVRTVCQLVQPQLMTADGCNVNTSRRTAKPAQGPLASHECARMRAVSAGPQSCAAGHACAPAFALSQLFQGASGPCVADDQAAGNAAPISCSTLHHSSSAAAGAMLSRPHSLSQHSGASARDRPATPSARPARSITCMGSAPAAVPQGTLQRFSIPMAQHHEEPDRDARTDLQRARSVDSYSDDLNRMSLSKAAAAPSGVPGECEGPQLGPPDLQLPVFRGNSIEARAGGALGASADWGRPAELQMSAQLPCPSALATGDTPQVDSRGVDINHALEDHRDAGAAVSSLPAFFAPHPVLEHLIPYDGFVDGESADEAPLEPQPQPTMAPAGPSGRMAKQLQRRSAHIPSHAPKVEAPNEAASQQQDVQPSPEQRPCSTDAAVGGQAVRHASVHGTAVPQGDMALHAEPCGTEPQPGRLLQRPQAEAEACPSTGHTDQARTQQVPPSVLLGPQARPGPQSPAAVEAGPTTSRALVPTGAAGCTQAPEPAVSVPEHPRKRSRPRAAHGADTPAVLEELTGPRFREPCSEHVEGFFPGHVAKRSRRQGAELPPLLPSEHEEDEAEPDTGDGPVTVDHVQHVVEQRMQAAPGWRAQRRQIGMARAQRNDFRKFIQRILNNDPTLGECGSRVLRLKPTLDLDTTTFEVDMVLEALRHNHRIEALYIHNFEQGFADAQLERLMRLLRNGRIWACNIGENFLVTNGGWKRFLKDIPRTALAFTYVSEAHLRHTDLKVQMRAAIRINRILSPRRDPEVCQHISNMWFNPTGCKTRHCGSASEQDHDRRAAAAAPLQQVITQREREVSAVVRAKAIYAKFISFRNTLLRTVVDAGARARAVDPREAEPQLQSPVAVHGHETVSVNVHLVPGLKPFWGPEHPRRCPVGPCSEIPGSVDVRDLPGAVRELMVPYAHLPASILQRCGSEVDGIEAEQEAAERQQVMVASNERAEEVAAGLAERGLDALVFAVGSQDAQEEWADQHRIRMGSPKDFSDDAMARAVKCVGGHLRARLEVEGGLSDLMGRRIDIFLPVYVQWVAARVKRLMVPTPPSDSGTDAPAL